MFWQQILVMFDCNNFPRDEFSQFKFKGFKFNYFPSKSIKHTLMVYGIYKRPPKNCPKENNDLLESVTIDYEAINKILILEQIVWPNRTGKLYKRKLEKGKKDYEGERCRIWSIRTNDQRRPWRRYFLRFPTNVCLLLWIQILNY